MQSLNKFNHNTQIVGVIGHPIKHSYSPLMHNVSFDLSGLNYIYLPFDVPLSNLESALKGMIALGIRGFNVTLPHKEKITQYLSDISEEAGVISAVNTVVNDNGKLVGYNTDMNGIVETLNPYKEAVTGSEVTIIGSGGAARSVIYALIRHYKVDRINIVNRTPQKAESLKDYFSAKMHFGHIKVYNLVPPDLVEKFRDSKLIVNTAPVGMSPDTDDAPTTIEESFVKDQIVFDLIYNPLNTKLLKIAEEKGAVVVNGLKMFVEQGARSYELWTGEKMPKDQIMKTLQSCLEG